MTGLQIVLSAVVVAAALAAASNATAVAGSSQDLSAQRRAQITVYPRTRSPGPNAKRQCRAWLVKEYRVSGPVIVPRQRCWWSDIRRQ